LNIILKSKCIFSTISRVVQCKKKNDYNTGTQLNLFNYGSLYPVIYFDLSYQDEQVTRDPKQLTFRYTIKNTLDTQFSVHTIVFTTRNYNRGQKSLGHLRKVKVN